MKISRLQAVRKHYESIELESKETIEIYLTNAVGIGEHPQIMEELRKQIEQYSHARDCIQNIDQLISEFTNSSNEYSN